MRLYVSILVAVIAAARPASAEPPSDEVDSLLEKMNRRARGDNAPAVKLVPDELAALKSLPANTVITMERWGGYWGGPQYRVQIQADGLVRFEGIDGVAVFGERTAQIEPNQVLRLLHLAGGIGFTRIDEATLRATCQSMASDAGTARLAIVAVGTRHEVKNYHGCRDSTLRPALRTLEQSIEVAAVKAEWLEPAKLRADDGRVVSTSNGGGEAVDRLSKDLDLELPQ